MNRATIRSNIRANLADNSTLTFSDLDINTSIQEAYNLVAAQCYNIIKSITLDWLDGKIYYDFESLGVTDYLGTIGIFNLNTNFWLRDDLSLRDYDRLRRDWEMWVGQPMFWTPHSRQYIAVAPKLAAATGQYTLWYWAKAPIMSSDADVPLIASDMQTLLEHFGTADLLDSIEETTKAGTFWTKYYNNQPSYAERCLKLAKADLLLRI